jgi:hypoxanthine-guanine phosphoribosyltransferase
LHDKSKLFVDIEVVEQNWVEITADWLREHEVVRVFIAEDIMGCGSTLRNLLRLPLSRNSIQS